MKKNEEINQIEVSKFISLLEGANGALEKAEREINRLNVFPVPDGDTGTNMRLTLASVIEGVRSESPADYQGLAVIMKKRSLLGARGNSGVILSQIIKGLSEVIAPCEIVDTDIFADSLIKGSDVGYAAVSDPVEGTILTVIRDVAGRADINRELEMGDFLAVIADEARKSTERTTMMLPILEEAGVVDAGGFGLSMILEGMSAAWSGREITFKSQEVKLAELEEDLEFDYCTEFILRANDINEADMREKLKPLGGSVIFVGDGDTYKVHIHSDTPGKVLDICTDVGTVQDIAIHNLALQSKERSVSLEKELEGIGIVAVATGDGVKEILMSLGVSAIVEGGQTMNPSAEDILNEIEGVPYNEVIVIPNNKNIVMAAEQASKMSDKVVAVVPSRSIPQAISALLMFDEDGDLSTIAEEMTEALGNVSSLSLTKAIRDSKGIRKGDWLGLFEDDVIAVSNDPEMTIMNLLSKTLTEEHEIMTMLFGSDFDSDVSRAISKSIEAKFPSLEIDLRDGGQPLYPLIIGIE